MNNNQTRQQEFNKFANKNYQEARDYAESGNVNPLNTLAHVADTARGFERFYPGDKDNVLYTGEMYKAYNEKSNNEKSNKGGSSRKMRSYRNKSNKRNKRNKRTGRTRRGKRRLH